MEDIRMTVRNFVVSNFLLGHESDLKDDDSFMQKGIVDSTGILEVVGFIESKYCFKIDDEDLLPENLDSINNLVKYVTTRITA